MSVGRRLGSVVVICVFCWAWFLVTNVFATSVEIMPLSEVKAGMTGYCLTALKGFKPERLEIKILGVLWGVAPRANRILFEGTDKTFKRFGILAGMSGSPCYIDDKLIGALSYGWIGEKEPIGGITPIEEMLRVLKAPVVHSATRGTGGVFAAAEAAGMRPYLDENGRFRLPLKLPPLNGFGQHDVDLVVSESAASGNPLLSRFLGARLRPIPLSFVSRSAGLNGLASKLGIMSVGASSQSPIHISPEQLKPGCPLGEALVTGDMDIAGMGTMTYRDGDVFLAFGHPSFGGGSVSYPMCSGIVHTGFPSYIYNFKISSSSQPLGVITQDRYPAIAGKIGAKADTLPVDLWLTGAQSGRTRKFHFEMIRNKRLTPLLLGLVADYSIYACQHESGEITIDWNILMDVKKHEPVRITDSLSMPQYSYRQFMMSLTEPFAAVIDNGFEDVRLNRIEMKLRVSQSTDTADILSIDVDKKRVRPGESLELSVGVLPRAQKERTLRFKVTIPKSCQPGPAELMVFGADAYQMWEAMRAKAKFRPQNYKDVIDMLVEAPNHRQLLVVLARRRFVAMRGREVLPDLPASARAVLSSAASSETRDRANFEVLQKVVFKSDFNLSGKKKVRVRIKPRKL